MSVNPFCEHAVEEGIRLKEKGIVSELIAVSIGADKSQETLRQALAMGADRAIHVKTDMRTDQDLQPLATAKILQKVVEKEGAQLVLCGKQAIDDDCNQTGQMLAGLLSWPQATFSSKLEFQDGNKSVKVGREVDAGLQDLEIPVPAVITADLRLNEPRYATLPNLMKAKKKPMEKLDADSLGVDCKPRLNVLKVEEPATRAAGVKVGDMDELMSKLRNEAKVLA